MKVRFVGVVCTASCSVVGAFHAAMIEPTHTSFRPATSRIDSSRSWVRSRTRLRVRARVRARVEVRVGGDDEGGVGGEGEGEHDNVRARVSVTI